MQRYCGVAASDFLTTSIFSIALNDNFLRISPSNQKQRGPNYE